jgi:hypothetical protein
MQCTNGHDNPDGQRFCGECGAPLVPPPPEAPVADHPPVYLDDPINADWPNQTDDTHEAIHERIAAGQQTSPAEQQALPAKRRRKWPLITAVAGIVAIVIIAVAAGGGSDTSDEVRRSNDATHSSVVRDDSSTVTTPTTEPVAHKVTITGNGFTQLPPDSIGASYVSYGVVVQNPSDDIATRVSLNVAFYNDAGVVVKAESPTIDVILPGQTAAYGESIQAAGATRMEVQALVGSWEPTTAATGAFTASGVSTTPRDYLGLQTNATLASTFAKDLKEVVAVAIYRDGNGAIVGGDRTFVDFVPAGGSAAVEITNFSDLPAPAATEVYAELSNLSLLGT